MMPLYGFLEGDTIGLLVLADEQDTIARLADKLQDAAALRVPRRASVRVWAHGGLLEPGLTVSAAGLQALDRFDVTQSGES
jgi:Toluene-4-monooxygenase system protein B (TmoB)